MNSPKEDGAGRVDGRPPTPPPSAGVQLEVAILAADHDAPGPEPAATDERPHRTVLVVAAEPDLHRYIRECLRERTDVLVLEAETVAAAVMLASVPTRRISSLWTSRRVRSSWGCCRCLLSYSSTVYRAAFRRRLGLDFSRVRSRGSGCWRRSTGCWVRHRRLPRARHECCPAREVSPGAERGRIIPA